MPICVSVISYLNTIPFVYGLLNHSVSKLIEIKYATPAQAANDLLEGKTDIGIIPSAIIPSLGKENIVSDYCIGATGNVASVLLCSAVPVNEIKRVYLDSESRTSVLLSRILFRNYWDIHPEYAQFEQSGQEIDYSASYVLIGDKALIHRDRFNYVYDLAQVWIDYKNLPFVFACWTSNKRLDAGFINEFNNALRFGVENIESAVKTIPHHFDNDYAYHYLVNNISYDFGPDKKEGLSEFWNLALQELKYKVKRFG